MDDIARIAEGLSEAQRRAMATMPEKYIVRRRHRVRWSTLRALWERDLLGFTPLHYTPLGQAVRAYLLEKG